MYILVHLHIIRYKLVIISESCSLIIVYQGDRRIQRSGCLLGRLNSQGYQPLGFRDATMYSFVLTAISPLLLV